MSRSTAFVFFIAIFFAVSAQAGYASTDWGMNPEQVAQIFPGGTSAVSPRGTIYNVFRDVGGFHSVTTFFFYEGKLIEIALQFPMAVNPADISLDSKVEITTTAMAKTIYDSLLNDLTEKYGKPKTGYPNMGRSWQTKDTIVGLGMGEVRPGYSSTVLKYTPVTMPGSGKKKKRDGRWEQI